MPRLRMAVIGVGHLGKEHARILAGLPGVELVGVADVSVEQAESVARRCSTYAFTDYRPLLEMVDAATIVVPTAQHATVGADFLKRRIPVLIEKPLALDLAQATSLVDLAARYGAMLQVGHIERFNPAFEELARRPLQPKYVECERLGTFTGRSMDIGVVMDLMIHDLDLVLALVRAPIRSVDAIGVALFGKHEDVANARLVFENGCVVNLTASRASAAPRRRMRIWAPEGYVHLDFAGRQLRLVQPSDRLRHLAARGLDAAARNRLKESLFGDGFQVLHLDGGERSDQLTRELQEFVHCVQAGARPRVGGDEARDAISLAAQVLDRINSHAWEGNERGPIGPTQLPAPLGPLFVPRPDRAAA